MDLGELFRRSASRAEDDPDRVRISRIGELALLHDACAAFTTRHEFRVGMVIRPKPALPYYRTFSDNGLAVVVELLAGAPMDLPGQSGNGLRQSMLILERKADGDFGTFSVDARFFEPVPEDDNSNPNENAGRAAAGGRDAGRRPRGR